MSGSDITFRPVESRDDLIGLRLTLPDGQTGTLRTCYKLNDEWIGHIEVEDGYLEVAFPDGPPVPSATYIVKV